MLAIVLAGLSAAVWGVADFAGGKASQRADPRAVALASQVLGLPVLAVALLLVPGRPHVADLAWGLAAGAAGFIGLMLLYRGLASGAMAVVAPVTAVTAALVPIAVGLLLQATPGPLAVAGSGCAVLAIGLVSMGPGGRSGVVTPALIGLALTAGATFGAFFALLGQAEPDSGMWTLVAVRVGSISLGVVLLLAGGGLGQVRRLPRAVLPWVVAAGVLDITANGAYVAAAARGHLSVVAAIASLYPASTVLLAIGVDKERVRPAQIVGLGLAATALVLASV